jgi:hypothetical protein
MDHAEKERKRRRGDHRGVHLAQPTYTAALQHSRCAPRVLAAAPRRLFEEVAHYLSSSCGAAGAASRTTTATEPSVGASAALRTELSRWLTELADEVSRRRFGNDRVVVHLGLIICSSNLPMLCYM